MRPRMRLAGPLFGLGLVALAGAAGPGAWLAAGAVERLGLARAQEALAAVGADWAEVGADGLRLRLRGAHPGHAARAAALGAVSGAVPLAVLEDATRAAPAAGGPGPDAPARVAGAAEAEDAAPDDAAQAPEEPTAPLVLLREGEGATVAGGVHPDLAAELLALLRDELGRAEVGDGSLARRTPPSEERRALARAAARAVAALPQARAELGPGLLKLSGTAPDEAARESVERRLRAEAPEGAFLLLDISTPPPTLSPFRFAISLEPGGEPTLLACDLRSERERAAVLAGLDALFGGAPPQAGALCRLGVGAPSQQWGEAALAGAEALARIGGGRFEMADNEARLVSGAEVRPTRFDTAARTLAAALPPGFSLRVTPPPEGPRLPVAEEDGEAEAAPVWFAARRDEAGVRLTGAAPDAATRDAVAAFARSRFGAPAVEAALEVTEAAPPPAWRRAALAGLAALSAVDRGRLKFDGERVALTGRALAPGAAREAAEALAPLREIGLEARAAVTIDLPALAQRLPLPPEACLAELGEAVEADPIGFDPGAAGIAAESRGVLDRLAAILRRCEGIRVEIGGHTDAQGRESTNLALSRARAEAVLDALFARGVSMTKMTARGYGEAQPVASNATEAGRALNRRIAFSDAEGDVEVGEDGEDGA